MSSKGLKKRFSFVRYLSIRSAGCPTFSSDGKHVAFLMNTTGVPQVWRVALDGGWPEQLTFYSEEVSFCRYSPVGDHLIFGMDRGGNERVQFYLLREGADAEPLTNKPNVIHTFGDWARDGRWITYSSNERHEAFFDAYAMNVESKECRRILQHDGTNYASCFTPDRKKALVDWANSNLDRDLYLVNLESGEIDHLTPHQGEAYYSDGEFSSDGTQLFFASNEDREFAALVAMDLKSRKVKILAEPSWDVGPTAVSNDGSRIAFAINIEGHSELRILPVMPRGIGLLSSPE